MVLRTLAFINGAVVMSGEKFVCVLIIVSLYDELDDSFIKKKKTSYSKES